MARQDGTSPETDQDGDSSGTSRERPQKSVTLTEDQLERLRDAYPHALNDNERIRAAIYRALEIEQAGSYQIDREADD